MKTLAEAEPEQTRTVLMEYPQLIVALLHAKSMLGSSSSQSKTEGASSVRPIKIAKTARPSSGATGSRILPPRSVGGGSSGAGGNLKDMNDGFAKGFRQLGRGSKS